MDIGFLPIYNDRQTYGLTGRQVLRQLNFFSAEYTLTEIATIYRTNVDMNEIAKKKKYALITEQSFTRKGGFYRREIKN